MYKGLFLIILIGMLALSGTAIARHIDNGSSGVGVKQGDKITITTLNTMARLLPYPNAGENQHITRIPQGTVLVVEGIQVIRIGGTITWDVAWFEVTYKGKRGWISICNTDKQR